MIDVNEFERMVKKVETLKEKQARASGTIESTEKQLADLGVTDMDTIDDFIKEKEAECTSLQEVIASEYEKLKGMYSWQFV